MNVGRVTGVGVALFTLFASCRSGQDPIAQKQVALTAASGIWNQLASGSPTARDQPAMTFDESRGVAIVFGGVASNCGTGEPLTDTWEWDGTNWTQVALTGTQPAFNDVSLGVSSQNGGIAYDVSRQVTVFVDNTGATYERSSDEWTKVSATLALVPNSPVGTAPAVITSGGGLTYDRDRQRIVYADKVHICEYYVGAQDGGLTPSWICYLPGGPSPRPCQVGVSAGVVYDEINHQILVVGGAVSSHAVYAARAATTPPYQEWTTVGCSAPTFAGGAQSVQWPVVYDRIDATHGKLVLNAHGTTFESLDSGATWTSLVVGPESTTLPGLTYDRAHGRSILFPGSVSGTTANDTWYYENDPGTQLSEWQRALAPSPPLRDAMAIAYEPSREATIVFAGGGAACGNVYDDLWQWNGTAWSTLTTTNTPGGRSSATMFYDPQNGLVVFGGLSTVFEGSTTILADGTWLLGSFATAWTQPPLDASVANPTPRYGAAAAFDPSQHDALLFGGLTTTPVFTAANDTWQWSSVHQSWTQLSPTAPLPPARANHAMAYDGTSIQMFGGEISGGVLNDMWTWNQTAQQWTQVAQTGEWPSARYGHQMTWDEHRGVVVLYGGYGQLGDGGSSTTLSDTWEWDGAAWHSISAVNPGTREEFGLVYDVHNQAVTLFGGINSASQIFGDVWQYQSHGEACTTGQTCDTGSCVDGVCCASTSCGTCQACNITGHIGVCTTLSAANAPSGNVQNDGGVARIIDDSCSGSCGPTGLCGKNPGESCGQLDADIGDGGLSECNSGFCVSGVCCATACNQPCQVCSAALGASADGTCGAARINTCAMNIDASVMSIDASVIDASVNDAHVGASDASPNVHDQGGATAAPETGALGWGCSMSRHSGVGSGCQFFMFVFVALFFWRRRPRGVMACALLTLVLFATVARAETPPMKPAAKQFLDRGLHYYGVGDYTRAIEVLEQGLALEPARGEFFYALGQAARQKADYPAAIHYYYAFLKTGPSPRQARAVAILLERCEAEVAQAKAAAEAAAPPPPVEKPIAPPEPPPVVVETKPIIEIKKPPLMPVGAAWLHLGATGFGEMVSLHGGAEVDATAGLGNYIDVGASCLLGSHIGARAIASFHGRRPTVLHGVDLKHRLGFLVSARVVVQPLGDGKVAGGAGAELAATAELGPGRFVVGVVGEGFAGNGRNYYPGALLLVGGYEFDLFKRKVRVGE